jgi:predicted metal-dependent peptidase
VNNLTSVAPTVAPSKEQMEQMEKEAMHKVVKARAALILEQPFFGTLALKLKVLTDWSAPTMWTNGIYMGFNPDFVLNHLSFEQTKGVICHEVMHCAMAHMCRRDDRHMGKWNVAADYAVNGIILNAGFALPDGICHNTAYDGMSAEAIYPLLPDQGGGKGKDDGGDGWDTGCGEVRDLPPSDARTGSSDDDQGSKHTQASPAEKDEAITEWKIAADTAAKAQKAAGKMPAGLDRFIKELVNPKVPWTELLRQFVERAAKNDYTWRMPNRRYIPMGVFLPSLYSEELGSVVIAIDTSGSVTEEELTQFASEISSILEEYPTTITVIYCDSRVAGHQVFERDDLPLDLQPKGGGGTDFRPPFKFAEKEGLEPVCFIYLTDMECDDYPDEPPDYPVMWVSTQELDNIYYGGTPPFGEVIEM